mmetsp:Transcript_98707/g.193929  ORF Transcript_98707/g.193929 Transcript_98707/m.193929 type:complete len:233 (+) Transcript_98707:398-1096(+)
MGEVRRDTEICGVDLSRTGAHDVQQPPQTHTAQGAHLRHAPDWEAEVEVIQAEEATEQRQQKCCHLRFPPCPAFRISPITIACAERNGIPDNSVRVEFLTVAPARTLESLRNAGTARVQDRCVGRLPRPDKLVRRQVIGVPPPIANLVVRHIHDASLQGAGANCKSGCKRPHTPTAAGCQWDCLARSAVAACPGAREAAGRSRNDVQCAKQPKDRGRNARTVRGAHHAGADP